MNAFPLGSTIPHHLFSLGAPWPEKVIRAVAVYAFLLVAIRLFGRRELGSLTAFDLVVLLTLSNILQNAMIGEDSSLIGGILGAITLLSANFLLAYAVYRSRKVRHLVEGQPRVLIRDGVVLNDALGKELLSEQDLLSAVRREGLEGPHEVRLAFSEPNGMISVIPLPREQRPS
jgi:uncharacterized membrane protein YcaP (DUF421 family)